MATLNFPHNPNVNDIHSENASSWRWDGDRWKRIADPGAQGAQGAQGNTGGAQGVQGAQGKQGAQGYQGYQGKQGAQGHQGHQGYQGYQGEQGAPSNVAGPQGAQGEDGNFGGVTFDYTFSDVTTEGDPGQGRIRITESPFSGALTLCIDDVDVNDVNIETYLRTIDDSTSLLKGHYRISNKSNSDDFAIFSITGSSTEESGYHKIPSSYISGVTSFSNNEDIIITFARTGDKGDSGAQGEQGNQGHQGNQGKQGAQGHQGHQGNQGYQGNQGKQGDDGAQGHQGKQGATGADGNQGEQGHQGHQGEQGYQGKQGQTGVGNQGEQGHQGKQGQPGTGSDGAQGSQGHQGKQGQTGTGSDGAQGAQGYQGKQGQPGNATTGAQGHQGDDGAQGYQGKQGAPGSGASNAGTVTVRTDSGNAWHNLIFVDSTTDNQNQILKMDDESAQLQWNPHGEILASRVSQTQYIKDWNNGDFGAAGKFLSSNGTSSPWAWENVSYNDLTNKPSNFLASHGVEVQIKTSNDSNWSPPTGCTGVVVYCIGGGGSSGSAHSNFDDSNPRWGKAGGGGSGCVAWNSYNATQLGGGASITIGSGGSAPNWANAGNAGGTTTFNPDGTGSTLSAGGGGGSAAAGENTNGAGGAGGGAYTGKIGHWVGDQGDNGSTVSSSVGANGSATRINSAPFGIEMGYGWGGQPHAGGDGNNNSGNAGGNGAVFIFCY